jgi:class 3 adenylate cyclase
VPPSETAHTSPIATAQPSAAAPATTTSQRSVAAGRLDRVTRRFFDDDLEADYQLEAGRELRESVGLGQLFGGLLWLGALLILPQFAPVDTTLTTLVIVGVWISTLVGYLVMRRLEGLDDLQAVVLMLNVVSMGAALAIATLTPGLQHQAAPAVITVALYAFIVLRLRFAFAVVLAVIHIAAFTVFTVTRLVPTAFALELFLVTSASLTGVLAAWFLETGSRQVFAQRRVIEAQAQELKVEKQKSDDLLLNVLPAPIAARKIDHPDAIVAEAHEAVSVLFADLVGFTPLAERLTADETVLLLDRLFTRFDLLVEQFGLNKVKTIGDAYMAVGGAPEAMADHALKVVRMGMAMLAQTDLYAIECGLPLRLRVGVNSGPIVAGVIGTHRFAYDLWGDTVNVASRMESHGVEGRVQISEATWRLVRDEIPVEERGTIEVKGKGLMRTFLVRAGTPDAEVRAALAASA